MKQRSCKSYFISLQLRFMEKLLIIFLGWQQHHNIKENPKCTNFYSPSLLLNLLNTNEMCSILFNIKYSARAAWRMNGDNLGTIRVCGHTMHTAHTTRETPKTKLATGKHRWDIKRRCVTQTLRKRHTK